LTEALLKINDMTHYFGGLRAVGNFNLTMEPRQLVGLIGPNGAGKTTIFNLITGVYKPTHGEIWFDGKNITGLPSYQVIQSGIARTFQTIRLYGTLPVIENVMLGRNFHVNYGLVSTILRLSSYRKGEQDFHDRAMELLDRFGLADRAYEYASSLPYGEQRRLEICRALASSPKLLLLDEPAAGMNPQEVEKLMGLINWVHAHFDITILLIEHQMRVIMGICPHIVVMDFGEVIARGNPEEIQRNPQVIEAYLGSDDEEVA
jgi:branched-chain amino acid transport system ATP-binding protein